MIANNNLIISEGKANLSVSNDREHNHQKNLTDMTGSNMSQKNSKVSKILEQLSRSPLRKGRLEFMNMYFEERGRCSITANFEKRFPGMTRVQVEQAIDDLIILGYARISRFYQDGVFEVEFIGRNEKEPPAKEVS